MTTHKRTGQYARKVALGHDYNEAKSKTKMPTYTDEELATEVWAPVPVETPYPLEASNLGRIRLADTCKVLPHQVTHSGYLIVTFPWRLKAKPHNLAVAPLVWSAWNPTLSRIGQNIAFVDGNKANVRPSNLVAMAHLRAIRRRTATPVLVDGVVYPGTVEVARAYAVTIPTIVRWIAHNRTRWGNPIRFAPEYAKSMDGLTVRL